MRLSFDLIPLPSFLVSEPSTPATEDHFETESYIQKASGFLSKTVSTVNQFWLLNRFSNTLGSNLPESYQKIFYELDPEESLILNQFLEQLALSQTPLQTTELLSSTSTSLLDMTSPRTQDLLDLVRNLCANKSLINTQFATDSLLTLLNLEDSRNDRYYCNTLAIQELVYKNPAIMTCDEKKFSDEMDQAAEAARVEKLQNAQWTLAGTPGLGYMSHSGWEHTSCPTLQKNSLFYAVRTLGLTRHGKTCFARVPLDFSDLGPLSLEQAKILLKAVLNNANKDKPELDPMPGIDPKAKKIIVQFSQDLSNACLGIHTRLQESDE